MFTSFYPPIHFSPPTTIPDPISPLQSIIEPLQEGLGHVWNGAQSTWSTCQTQVESITHTLSTVWGALQEQVVQGLVIPTEEPPPCWLADPIGTEIQWVPTWIQEPIVAVNQWVNTAQPTPPSPPNQPLYSMVSETPHTMACSSCSTIQYPSEAHMTPLTFNSPDGWLSEMNASLQSTHARLSRIRPIPHQVIESAFWMETYLQETESPLYQLWRTTTSVLYPGCAIPTHSITGRVFETPLEPLHNAQPLALGQQNLFPSHTPDLPSCPASPASSPGWFRYLEGTPPPSPSYYEASPPHRLALTDICIHSKATTQPASPPSPPFSTQPASSEFIPAPTDLAAITDTCIHYQPPTLPASPFSTHPAPSWGVIQAPTELAAIIAKYPHPKEIAYLLKSGESKKDRNELLSKVEARLLSAMPEYELESHPTSAQPNPSSAPPGPECTMEPSPSPPPRPWTPPHPHPPSPHPNNKHVYPNHLTSSHAHPYQIIGNQNSGSYYPTGHFGTTVGTKPPTPWPLPCHPAPQPPSPHPNNKYVYPTHLTSSPTLSRLLVIKATGRINTPHPTGHFGTTVGTKPTTPWPLPYRPHPPHPIPTISTFIPPTLPHPPPYQDYW